MPFPTVGLSRGISRSLSSNPLTTSLALVFPSLFVSLPVNEILERHESGDAVQTEHKEGVVETNEEETEEESPVSEVIAAPVPAEDQNYEAPDRNSENQLSVTDQELQTVSSETATGSVENDRDTDRNTER